MPGRNLELGAIQAHILYHATVKPVYGSWMAEELVRHGFSLSYGTLYPMLHRMQQEGLLECREQRDGRQVRKYYTATEQGHQELEQVRHLIRELYQEIVVEAHMAHSSQSKLEGDETC
jgi:PadR family transcriptional regulator PadR